MAETINLSQGCTSETYPVNSIEGLLDATVDKIEKLEMGTLYIQNFDDCKDRLQDVQCELTALRDCIDEDRKFMEKMKQQNLQLKRLAGLLELLAKRTLDLTASDTLKKVKSTCNQSHIISDEEDNRVESTVEKTENEIPTMLGKKLVFDEPEVCTYIRPIDEEEFAVIPKYALGRQSINTLNSLVTTVNQLLDAKYTLLSRGKDNARKKGQLDLYLQYRKEQSSCAEGGKKCYFFTAEEYKQHTQSKLDRTTLNLLTILRLCKRIHERRSSNTLLYIVS